MENLKEIQKVMLRNAKIKEMQKVAPWILGNLKIQKTFYVIKNL